MEWVVTFAAGSPEDALRNVVTLMLPPVQSRRGGYRLLLLSKDAAKGFCDSEWLKGSAKGSTKGSCHPGAQTKAPGRMRFHAARRLCAPRTAATARSPSPKF